MNNDRVSKRDLYFVVVFCLPMVRFFSMSNIPNARITPTGKMKKAAKMLS
jgi:hypothetical protein